MKVTKVQTETVMSGKEMLARVAQEYFDMILLDHMMPELDGIETLHRMRSMGDIPCKDMPVIILTANAVTGAREEYLEEGFTDFLAKPIDSTHLEKMLCTYLPKELLEEGMPQEHQDSSNPKDYAGLERKNIKAYTIEVHALKSAAAVVGEKELSKMAAHLEYYGNHGE